MIKYKHVVEQIPAHLRQFVVDQDYSRYTAVDQATWRFILRQLKHYLSRHAHECYVEGLEKTGISVESIPRIETMCEKLQQFGWTAIPVSGFIPPAAFMELQSLSFLPIASDMRTLDHILYTPAPDIVHEAAGHAPILIDPDFANYLKEYAQVAKKAIISSEDLAQYEAIRDLSDIKENPQSTPEQIAAAEKHLNDVNASMSHVSEAALLGRMNWWTAEYGLIGDVQSPKIFGAGLLSSVGEARGALQPKVKKIPLSVDCIQTSYDITEQQPQLFVAESFTDLSKVLHQLEEQLSYKRGGLHGLKTALQAATVNTVQLNSGLQISGKITEYRVDAKAQPIFFKFTGPVQLCEKGQEIPGHSVATHAEGFSSPVGKIAGFNECLSELSAADLKELGFEAGKPCDLYFASGISLKGTISGLHFSTTGALMILSFSQCTVKHGEDVLFDPAWGSFDLAVGSQVVSVYGGPADRVSYGMTDSFVKKTIPKKTFSDREVLKHSIYQHLRDMREKRKPSTADDVRGVLMQLQSHYPQEWLAYVETLELCYQTPELAALVPIVRKELDDLAQTTPNFREYIQLGLELADRKL